LKGKSNGFPVAVATGEPGKGATGLEASEARSPGLTWLYRHLVAAFAIGLWSILNPLAAIADSEVAAVSPDTRIERLGQVCKLWGQVKYTHPYLAHKAVRWDEALVKAVSSVRTAGTTGQYARALEAMLGELGDPVTAIQFRGRELSSAAAPPNLEPSVETRRIKGILGVKLNARDYGTAALRDALGKKRAEILEAAKLLFDLRTQSREEGEKVAVAIQSLAPMLTAREITTPEMRYLLRSGYVSETTGPREMFFPSFVTDFGQRIVSPEGHKSKRVAFVIDRNSVLPPIGVALVKAGGAVVVSQGRVTDAVLGIANTVAVGEELEATVRIYEMTDGWTLKSDAEVAADLEGGWQGPAITSALRLLDGKPKMGRYNGGRGKALSAAVWHEDEKYAAMLLPSSEYRFLALCRVWTAIRLFYPYLDLLENNWDAVLTEFIPRFEAANDPKDYLTTLKELASRVPDNHVLVVETAGTKRDPVDRFGFAVPPVAVRLVEGKLLITQLLESAKGRDVGLNVGDVITEVDGQSVNALEKEIPRYFGIASSAGRAFITERIILGGAEGSLAVLQIVDGAARSKQIKLERRNRYLKGEHREGDVVRVLPENIGYADLDRLEASEVDAMFEKLKSTKAIVFDLRGYPRNSIWAIAPRLARTKDIIGAVFDLPVVFGRGSHLKFQYPQLIGSTEKWKYTGKTIALIDERAFSHAEHTGLLLEAANSTTFVGSPTVGTNGSTSTLFVPGDIRITFTGLGVRHGDGRQLQRIGLIPQVKVTPTIRGIREGRDEVLDAAIKFLKGMQGSVGPTEKSVRAGATGGQHQNVEP
jgi:C-terminal processing protease CtpA/Prc